MPTETIVALVIIFAAFGLFIAALGYEWIRQFVGEAAKTRAGSTTSRPSRSAG